MQQGRVMRQRRATMSRVRVKSLDMSTAHHAGRGSKHRCSPPPWKPLATPPLVQL